jgi:threonine aldolase
VWPSDGGRASTPLHGVCVGPGRLVTVVGVDDDFQDRYRIASEAARQTVTWRRETPAEHFGRLAEAADELDLGWDVYGARGAVAMLEEQVADLLGTEAAVMLPSGVMGQQAMLRVWCDRAGSTRVALPDLSHLLHHEADGPRLVHGLRFEHLTTGSRVATADDLAEIPGDLGAVLVELPLRDAGCLLPSWEQLQALSEAARTRGVALHLDGARLWESLAHYDRPPAEIAGLFDSVYVSLYKGLGAMSGAVVATDSGAAAELRLWRTRMGGTLMRMTPYAVGGLLGLRDQLPRMADYRDWARDLARELTGRGLRVHPAEPHISTFLVYADGSADEINARLLAFVERESTVLSFPFRDSDVPGVAVVEVAYYAAALDFEPAQVADWFLEVVQG